MPPNPVHQLNRAVCQADSTYSMTVKEIRILSLHLSLLTTGGHQICLKGTIRDLPRFEV
jgi:hypothetical protein